MWRGFTDSSRRRGVSDVSAIVVREWDGDPAILKPFGFYVWDDGWDWFGYEDCDGWLFCVEGNASDPSVLCKPDCMDRFVFEYRTDLTPKFPEKASCLKEF